MREAIEETAASFASEEALIEALREDTRLRLEHPGPASILEESERAWSRVKVRLDRWLEQLQTLTESVSAFLEDLESRRVVWRLTRDSAGEQALPREVVREVEETLTVIEDAAKRSRDLRDRALVLQAEISRTRISVDERIAVVGREISQRRRGLVRLDSPPLWRIASAPSVVGTPSEELSAVWRQSVGDIRDYMARERSSLLKHALLGAFVLAVLIGLRRRARIWVARDPSLERSARILDRPLSATLIITVLLRGALHPNAPLAWLDALSVIMLLALLRILPVMVTAQLRRLALYLAVLYLLYEAARLLPDGGAADRLLLLVLSLAASTVAWWVFRRITREPPPISRVWHRTSVVGTVLAAALFGVSAVANVFGAVGFASQLANETLYAVFVAVFFWVAADLLHAVVRVMLLSETAQRFGAIRLHPDEARTLLFRTIDVVAVVAWGALTLAEVELLGPVWSALKKALGVELSIGEITFSPGDIALFAVVVWLSFKLSQLIRSTLDADVYPRMQLPRGVPGAINRLTHYTVVVIGVMFAATAAGVDFTRLTFVIGALGVGIGFGLQNIVNNFVSGLILLFERPVRIGDRVELGTLSGTVEKIGIRASIVRTWQGAEVIVPNADLISSQVINWTLSDDRRRMEIPVGVAYGTDPEQVLDILLRVARSHDEVLTDPEPAAIFTGFGDSSLNFELRAWTVGDIVIVPSQLRVAANRALSEAGIEIPFPQRDLHLRSVDSESAARLVSPRNGGAD